MDMYDNLFSQGCLLNEQVARQIFEIFPDGGAVMVIVDREGHYWPSDSDAFAKLNINETTISDICEKIDDGVEPLITQIDEISLISGQLVTDRTNCGYVIIAIPQHSPEKAMANIDLLEIILNQVSLIAKLIEKNNMLYELQLKNQNNLCAANVGLN